MNNKSFELAYNDVNLWASLSHSEGYYGSPEHVDSVWDNIAEEFSEVRTALVSEDPTDLYKELADLMVTCMQGLKLHSEEKQVMGTFSHNLSVMEFIDNAKDIIEQKDSSGILYIMSMLCFIFDSPTYSQLGDVLQEVCKSNWTKYPSIEEVKGMYGDDLEEAIKAACEWIATEYEHKGFKDIVGVVKETKIVFMADNGKGKILKPWCYTKADVKSVLEGL